MKLERQASASYQRMTGVQTGELYRRARDQRIGKQTAAQRTRAEATEKRPGRGRGQRRDSVAEQDRLTIAMQDHVALFDRLARGQPEYTAFVDQRIARPLAQALHAQLVAPGAQLEGHRARIRQPLAQQRRSLHRVRMIEPARATNQLLHQLSASSPACKESAVLAPFGGTPQNASTVSA